MDRRDFLKVIGVGTGAALASSCSKKEPVHLIPYVVPPEDGLLPGKSLAVRTTCAECPAGCGVTAMVREKTIGAERRRFPIKLEGTAGHPVNDGALCLRGQISLTRLYHSARLKTPMARQADGTFAPVTWDAAAGRIADALARTAGKENIYYAGKSTGSLAKMIDDFCRRMGFLRMPEFELYSHAAIRNADEIVFGRAVVPSYAIDKADALLTIGADILDTFVSPVRFAGALDHARKEHRHFHWIHVDPAVSLTGLKADERLTAAPGSEPFLVAWLLQEVLKSKPEALNKEVADTLPRPTTEATAAATGITEEELKRLAHMVTSAHHPLVITGGPSTAHGQGFAAAVLTALLQRALKMEKETLDLADAVNDAHTGTMANAAAFSQKLNNNAVGVVILARMDIAGLLSLPLDKAAFRVGMGETMTETMKRCDVVLPLSHSLESWDIVEPVTGTLSLRRPAVTALYDTRSEGDILIRLMGEQTSYRQYARALYEKEMPALEKDGFVERPASAVDFLFNERATSNFLKTLTLTRPADGTSIVLIPSIRTYDGRGRDVALASEIPDPITSISYGRWVSLSRERAGKLGVDNGDEVKISSQGWSETLPAMILPAVAENILVIHRDHVNGPMPIAATLGGDEAGVFTGVSVEKTGRRIALPILSGVLALDKKHDEHESHHDDHHAKKTAGNGMYPEHDHKDYQWGMAVNLDACTGCSACVAACYIENNIPATGPAEHLKGRELSWIRVEPNYAADGAHFMPMMCQQCENAPCEPVCPALATYHNDDGLNAQIYNRCVGTRYCSNNCPYKVRRFNWFDYAWDGDLRNMLNPDVSMRSRGIMEKCTFCVQRIRAGKDAAKDENRKVRDGEITPACAQTCPADAIVFGNLLDPASRVSRLAAAGPVKLHLEEMGTRPKVYYLRNRGNAHGS